MDKPTNELVKELVRVCGQFILEIAAGEYCPTCNAHFYRNECDEDCSFRATDSALVRLEKALGTDG